MIDPTHTLSPEWQNENALRAYPLTDDAPAASVLPAWLLADLRITVDSAYGTVFVSSAYVSETLVSVGISALAANGRAVGLLTRSVTRDELEPFRAYSLDRMDGGASGTVTFGEPPTDGTAAFGRLTFTADTAPLVEAAILRIASPGVTKLVDTAYDTSADGIIDLSGNTEFRTSVDPDDPQTVVITLSDLYRDLTTSVCNATPAFDTCGETPIKTINGVGPNPLTGRITLKFR